MSNEERMRMNALDEAAEKAGGYVSTIVNKEIKYNFRELIKYCKGKGIEPADLTLRELNSFIVN